MSSIKELKFKELKKIRELSLEDFKDEVKLTEKALFEWKMKVELKELKQTHTIKLMRKYLARLYTVASEKALILN